MSKDPYKILDVLKEASDQEIKSSYRKLAKKFHPDLNPNNKEAETKFQEISSAYDLLQNKEKRAAYDRGEIDMEGNSQYQQQYYKDHAEGPQGYRYSSNNENEFDGDDIKDMFESMFGGANRNTGSAFNQQNNDVFYSIEIDFLEAALGTKKRITMPDGKTLDINIPKGSKSGQKLRLKGKGHSSSAGNIAGDAYIEMHVKKHDFYKNKENDIYVDVPISINEAILGGKIQVPTIQGKVEVSVPKATSSGTKLRLKGKGIKKGDQYINLIITMPEEIDKELEEFIKGWSLEHSHNPRKKKEFN